MAGAPGMAGMGMGSPGGATLGQMARTPYGQLQGAFSQAANYTLAAALLDMDAYVNAPQRSLRLRTEMRSEMEVCAHAGLRSDNIPRLIAQVRGELQQQQQNPKAAATSNQPQRPGEMLASLREMERAHRRASAVDPEVSRRKIRLAAVAEQARVAALETGVWDKYGDAVGDVLGVAREEAKQLALAINKGRYDSTSTVGSVSAADTVDAAIEDVEPGAKLATITTITDALRQWAPQALRFAPKAGGDVPVVGAAPLKDVRVGTAAQLELLKQILRAVGVNLDCGRIDASATVPNGFAAGGIPLDFRSAVKFERGDPLVGLLRGLRCGGLSRYMQGLPVKHANMPVGAPRSVAMMESQAALLADHVGRSEAFLDFVSGQLRAVSALDEASAAAICDPRRVRLVMCTASANDADEVSRLMHDTVRFDVGRALLAGDIRPSEAPHMWRELAKETLALDSLPEGAAPLAMLQTPDWASGQFVASGARVLGAAYAAQFADAMQRELGGPTRIDDLVRTGDHQPFKNWLSLRVWSKASELPTPSLMLVGTGTQVNPTFLRDHLMRRYFGPK